MPASSLLLHRPSSTPPSTPRTGAGGGGFSSTTTAGGSGLQSQPPGGMGSYASLPLVPEDGLHFASLAAALQVGNLGSGGAALTPPLVPKDGLHFASGHSTTGKELSMALGVGPDPSDVGRLARALLQAGRVLAVASTLTPLDNAPVFPPSPDPLRRG